MGAQQALAHKYIGDRYIEVFAYGADEEVGADGETRDSTGATPPPTVPGGNGVDFDATAPPPIPPDDPWAALFTFIQPTVPAPAPIETSKTTNAVPIWV